MEVKRSPQRIVVLCDGTWQQRRTVLPRAVDGTPTTGMGNWYTNVALLSNCIASAALQPDKNGYVMPQIVLYQTGIGAGSLLDIPSQLIAAATGLTFGLKVDEAYAFLVDNYLPGDELFLFGFSRGAYTARALAAFINYAGILSKAEQARSFTKIWRAYVRRVPVNVKSVQAAEDTFYRELGRWPSGNAMRSARGNVKAANELIGKDDNSLGSQDGDMTWNRSNRYPRVIPPPIKVVGVWDTVGALGVPGTFLSPDFSRYYSFFDPILAPDVEYAFHALSLGEDRKDFLPTLWYTPPADQEMETDAKKRESQVMKQVWFQGSHSDVGGGHAWHGLSDVTLAWMISQLVDRPEGPLLGIDLDRVKKLQDRRRGWARQGEHPSRWCFEFQATRNVGWWNMPAKLRNSAVWKDEVQIGNTNESIHFSVHVGNRYDPETSPQFVKVRGDDPARLSRMWNENKSDQSLWATEKALKWQGKQTDWSPDSAYMGADEDVLSPGSYLAGQDVDAIEGEPLPDFDPELGSVKPAFVPEFVWGAAKVVANVPVVIIATVVNLRVTPNRNLRPGILVIALAKLEQALERKRSASKAKTA